MGQTLFLSGGVNATAATLNAGITLGRSIGLHTNIDISIVGSKLVLSKHSAVLDHNACFVSDGEEYEVPSYLRVSGNSYRGTLLYRLDSSLHFDCSFDVVDGVILQEDTNDCVIGWIIYPGGSAALSSNMLKPAPKLDDVRWFDKLVDVGSIAGLTRTENDYVESYVNNGTTTTVAEIVRHFPTDESVVRSIRFHGALDDGVYVDFYVKSERSDWILVSTLAGKQSHGKYRIPVFDVPQGTFEMTSVRYIIRTPPQRGFSITMLGATNEISYSIKAM